MSTSFKYHLFCMNAWMNFSVPLSGVARASDMKRFQKVMETSWLVFDTVEKITNA